MSYRLIDSNDLAITYPEVNDMPCIYTDLPNGLDDQYYDVERAGYDGLMGEIRKLREIAERLRDRLLTADGLMGGGLIDARLVDDMQAVGIEVSK